MVGKSYHGSQHRRLGTPVVRAANANPTYRCPRCGLTRAEMERAHGKAAAKWVRGHKRRGQHATSPADYQAEHARCSAGEGGQVKNETRKHSRTWRRPH